MPLEQQPLTLLLNRWHGGDRAAGDELITIVYEQLKRMAGRHMQRERPDHTLEASALVHELYVRLSASEPIEWQNRAHFFAVATQQLRRILVNHARDAQAQKRGGKRVKISLTQIPGLAGERAEDVLYLHEALEELEKLNQRAARVIELRFFGGLSEEEAAEVIGVSLATLKRDWRFARAWLRDRLKQGR
jgi:RNA polymerase sigma factor (TIGR02999 family)